MKECDVLSGGRGSKHTLTLPTYFQGVKTPNAQDPRSGSEPQRRRWLDFARTVTTGETKATGEV